MSSTSHTFFNSFTFSISSVSFNSSSFSIHAQPIEMNFHIAINHIQKIYINIHILRINLFPKQNIMKSGAIRNIIRDKNDQYPNIWFSSGEKEQLYHRLHL
jgi:hypothetical protein